MKPIYPIICMLLVLLTSCNNTTETPSIVTNTSDYNHYLFSKHNKGLDAAQQDFKFWEKKLEKEPNQFPYLVKAAASQTLLFQKTGEIAHLIAAENYLIKANNASNYKNSGYLRALARNYISQHKFKEALEFLKMAETHGDKLKATQKMMFDVNLELGNTTEAKAYLNKIENYKDFDFLIRLSKWSDHEGKLDDAILYLTKATEIAETNKNKALMQWSYTNLADYYGHAGKIKTSYEYYLKALNLDPNDAYAKKGIAWILYSHEKNADEALRVLNTVTANYNAPDYHLLKAEIAEFKGDTQLKTKELQRYKNALNNKLYGAMYNKYNVLLYVENPSEKAKAIAIANEEIKNRPTPQSYDLLAWTYFHLGKTEDALAIMENHVVGKTFEPEAMYHVAEVYKANGRIVAAKKIKEELLESAFELGPIMTEQIEEI